MNFAAMEKVADAVLYEGYILYPYRPSSIKNRQRWNFGTLFPREWADAQSPPETSSFQTEILIEATANARIDVRIRFLQLVPGGTAAEPDWDEGFTRSRTLEGIRLNQLFKGSEHLLDLAAPSEQERTLAPPLFLEIPMLGKMDLKAQNIRENLYRLTANFANETQIEAAASRRSAQASAFTSAHLLLHVQDGAFVSLLEPASEFAADVAACTQQGVFPVLAGETGDRTRMLCSPIILYDFPQIAPESAGNFFDGTEMDEMLALRVLTLTDEEKAEMRRSDPHARAILERTEILPEEHLLKVHGAIRGLHPVAETVGQSGEIDAIIDPWDPFAERPPVEMVRVFGTNLRIGDRIRLWPQKKADIMDMAMEGKIAIIEAIEQDLEDNIQFAVVLEDDPGKDMGLLRQAGHRFFFTPEEVEPLTLEVS